MFSKIILQNLWRSGKHVRGKIIKTETPKVGWQSQTFKKLVDSTARQTIKQAFWRGRNDKNILLFAFAGFVIAKQSEEDKRLSEVQNIIHVKDQSDDLEHPSFSFQGHELSLELLKIGHHIGQGCNAAVYEARQKSEVEVVTETEETDVTESDEGENKNEDSNTESDKTVLSPTSQDTSLSAVVNVHEYDDEWNIRWGSDEVCDVSFPGWTENKMGPWTAVFIDHLEDLKDSDEGELKNEDSDTESDKKVLSPTSLDASAPAVVNVHEYDDEWHIRGGSDEVCDVLVPDWTEDEIEPWSAVDFGHMEDLKDSDEWEIDNENSDTESDIAVLSSTSHDTSLPFNGHGYDDEWNIRWGSDEVCDVSIPGWKEDKMEPWSAVFIDHLEDLKNSDEWEIDNEDSDTEIDITVLSSTSQDTSLPFNDHENDDECNISGDSDEVCDVTIPGRTEDEMEPCSAIDMEDLKDSDEWKYEHEDSDTESDITVLSSTSQDTSLPFNVHGYYDEWNIRGGSDDYNDVAVLDWIEDEMEPLSAIDNYHMEDRINSDEGKFDKEDSDTESDIAVLSSTSLDASASAVFNVHEYDDEWHIRGGSDEVCDAFVSDWTEDDIEPWSAIDTHHMEDSQKSSVVLSKAPSSSGVSFNLKKKIKLSKRARERVRHNLKKKRLCLEIVLVEQKIANDKELHQMRKEMLSRNHVINIVY